jgi:hypothetical protein
MMINHPISRSSSRRCTPLVRLGQPHVKDGYDRFFIRTVTTTAILLLLVVVRRNECGCGGAAGCCMAFTATTTSRNPNRFESMVSQSQTQLQAQQAQQSQQQGIQQPYYGNVHGTNACFLPLQQLEQDTYMPRILYIVNGIYPDVDLTVQHFMETPMADNAPPALGQWTYTFFTTTTTAVPPSLESSSTTTTTTTATIALMGSPIIEACIDPIMVIAEHSALGIVLPTDHNNVEKNNEGTTVPPPPPPQPVDVLVLVDRGKTYFCERKFIVYTINDNSTSEQQPIHIAAFTTRQELPDTVTILGHVEQVTIPWLPSMAPTKSGFLEADEYY